MKRLLYISKADRSKELAQFFDAFYHSKYEIECLSTDEDDYVEYYAKKYDVILVHHNRQILNPSILTNIAKGAFIIYWVNDERYPLPDWIEQYVKVVDLFLVASKDTKQAIEKKGGNAEYLIMGFKPKMWNNEKRHYDIVFTGQNSHDIFPLSQFRKEIVTRLKRILKDRFKLCGNGWGDGVVRAPSGIYLNSKIGLNIGHYATEHTYSNRVLQIMSNGAMLLCHSAGKIDEVFRDNAVYFKNYSELYEKLNYYLKHDDEREAIARKGFEFVNSHFTWKHKAIDIMNYIEKYGG